MQPLEDEIAALATLDALRAEARGMLQAGLRGLVGSTYDEHPQWEAPGLDRVRAESALLLWAIRVGHKRCLGSDAAAAALQSAALESVRAISARSLTSIEPGDAPVLGAARALEALVRTPDMVMSKASVTCLYRVLRELFSSEPPLWAMGAARAGQGCRATAYVTGECCAGILWLARALTRGADLCHRFDRAHHRRTVLASNARIPSPWRHAELQRIQRALDIDVTWLCCRTPFLLDALDTADLANAARQLAAQLDRVLAEIAEARRDIEGARARETAAIVRSEAPHRAALEAIDEVGARVQEAARSLWAGDWAQCAAHLTGLAKNLDAHLEPSRNYIGGVLDHELAAAATQNSDQDLPELAFAAAAYGMLHRAWDDPRLLRAADVLAARLSDEGRLPIGRPFQVHLSGFHLHPVNAAVVRGLATLFRRTHHVVTPELVASLLRSFRQAKREVTGGIAWTVDEPLDPGKASWWTTALSVTALDAMVHMISACLNERIEAHFATTPPALLKVDLEEAFYPDYGLARVDRPSVAMQLQRMRAHVLGIPRGDVRDPLASIVLYGPPGTGKTTLAEALARSAEARFVHITPSDIVLGGAEQAEHRARVVFQALAMLTDAVILFDEFDPLLRHRSRDGRAPSTIFELLTPGMLPKLEMLHDAAREQRVAYVLATNLVGSLDKAAIRDGRFDEKVGVYPPDLMSRLGRLLLVKPTSTPEQEERLLQVCAWTHDSPMSTLGRRGWYTADARPRLGTGQAYIDDVTNAPQWPTPEFTEVARSGDGKHADRELAEWLWVRAADVRLVGGPAPGGDLHEYLGASTWNVLRRELKGRSITWGEVTAALTSPQDWESFETWVMAESGHAESPPGTPGAQPLALIS